MALFSDPSSSSAAAPARQAVREASPWITRMARVGYAAIGIVYLVMGGLAAQAALSPTEQPDNSRGALRTIYDRPLGHAAILLVAVGLAGYVVWRLVLAAIFDAERKGSDLKGIAVRIGYVGSAVAYGSLAFECVRLLRGWRSQGSGGGDRPADHWTAVAMAQPLGRWIVAAVGAGVIVYGLYQVYRAVAGNLRKRLELSGVNGDAAKHMVRMGRVGYLARGNVFAIIGWFLVQAALQYDPEEAKDLAAALQVVRSQAHGPWLLGAVSLGLVCWGLWQLSNARYRRIRPA
jgi:hypothetical protein